MLGVGLALPGPFDVESMSFVGPTTMAGWKDVAAAASGLRRRPDCRPSSRPTWRPQRSASGSTASARNSRNTIISISASASAAPWFMTASCCAAPGAMPVRSAISLSFPTASLVPAATVAASNATSRWRRFGARQAPAGGLGRRGRADLAQRRRHHREPVRPADDHSRRAGDRRADSSGSRCRAEPAEFGFGATRPHRATGHRREWRPACGAARRGSACHAGVLSPRSGRSSQPIAGADARRPGKEMAA